MYIPILKQNPSPTVMSFPPKSTDPKEGDEPSPDFEERLERRAAKDPPRQTPLRLQNQTILVWKDPEEGNRESSESDAVYSSCSMFVTPGNPAAGVQPCFYGYTFQLNDVEWTIASEWLLVCNRLWLLKWLENFYFGSLILGGIVLGPLADCVGRKMVLITCLASFGIVGLGLYFVKRFILFFCLRCLQAILAQGLFVTSWTILSEHPPPKWRCRGLVIAGVAGPLGTILASVASLRLGHWRAIQLAVSLPVIASIFYSCLIPESLRWLLTRGKVACAHREANRMAQLNAFSLPPAMMASLRTLSDSLNSGKSISTSFAQKVKPLNLLRTPRLRKNISIIFFTWLTMSITEHVLRGRSTSTNKRKFLFLSLKSPFMESLLEGAVDVGGVFLVVMLSSLVYRRSLIMILMLCVALITLTFVGILKLLSGSAPVLWIILKCFGFLTLSGTRAILQVISSEVAPTNTRATVVGFSFSLFALGRILANCITYLGNLTYEILPWVICSILCLFGTLFLFLLPETSGVNLPDIEEEAEGIGIHCKGDIIKSDNDPNYGRSSQLLDVNHMSFRYTMEAPQPSHVVNFESVADENRISKFKKKASRPSMHRVLHKAENSHKKETEFSESSLSTSSCSLYSTTSFTPVVQNNCKSCLRRSSKKRVYKISQLPSTSSLELTSTENFSEENENECSITEIVASENNNHRTDEYAKAFGSRKSETDEKLNNISEESESTLERNNMHSKTSKSDQRIQLKIEIEKQLKNNLATNDWKNKGPLPKIVSTHPKSRLPVAKEEDVKEIKQNIEICALQPLHTKRTRSPADIKREGNTTYGKSRDSASSNLLPISKNLKLQNLATRSVQRCPSNSKYKTFDKNSCEGKNILLETPFRSNLSRQLSSIERTRSSIRLKLDKRPKTQSFLIPRKPRMGKLVSMHIERFEKENFLQPQQRFSKNIPLYSSHTRKTNIRTTPNVSFNTKTKIPLPVKHTGMITSPFNSTSQADYRTAGGKGSFSQISELSTLSPEDLNKSSIEGEFIIPRSDVEVTDEDEAHL